MRKKMDFSNGLLSRLSPVATALLLFFAVSALYFAPQFRGETLPQHDVLQYEGMTHDIRRARAETGEDPQWTGGMFGGMPAYLINVAYPAQLVKRTVGQVVRILDTPAAFLFFAMAAMWLMLCICGVDPWIGIVPALAYGLSTYFLLIIGAGHITKMWALVYAPPMMAGIYVALRGNLWLGAALTALAASLEIGANHPQITYYFLLAAAVFWISEAVGALRKGAWRDFALRTAVLAGAGLLAAGSNFAPLWYTAQHSKDTIRGGSELAAADGAPNEGLDLDYATAWSYGRAETLNLLVPDFMGRDSGRAFATDGEVAAALRACGFTPSAAAQLPAYWGEQPYTAGPTYLGATVLFLGILGLLLARGRNKWWILAVSLLMVLLAWGHHFMGFTELMFRYLPGYNKFRTVSMALVVVQWSVPLLGAMALTRLCAPDCDRKTALRAVAGAAAVTGGLCLILAAAGGSLFGFGRAESTEMMTEQVRHILAANGAHEQIAQGVPEEIGATIGDAMAHERMRMMRSDAMRSLLLILLTAGAAALYLCRKINKAVLLAATGVLVLADLVPVDLRFLSSDDFVPARTQRVAPTAADKEILRDTEPGYRVRNLTVDPFNDATTSYFHRSIGGYHGAKLARYQDLISRYMSDRNGNRRLERDEIAPYVLDMLNTRYTIGFGAQGTPQAERRGTEYGPAWFVDAVRFAATPQEEIDALETTDLRTTAVVADRDRAAAEESGALRAETPADARAETIRLTDYRPNYLRYEYTAPQGGIAVFSEIFYDKGWTAYVDGEPAPYFRADYLLRAMRLPAAENGTVEWRFRAPHWELAEGITGGCSLLILTGAAAAAVYALRKSRKRKAAASADR